MANYCWSCGKPVKPTQKFCGKCGAKLFDEPPIIPPVELPVKPLAGPARTAMDTDGNERLENGLISFLCLMLVVGCLFLWFRAPLAAINLLTMGDQPSGWTLLGSGDYEFEYLKDLTIFWLEIASLGGMLLCMLALLLQAPGGAKLFAALTVVSIVSISVERYRWLEGGLGLEGDMEYYFDAFGYGFWVIALLMLLVFLLSGGSKKHR